VFCYSNRFVYILSFTLFKAPLNRIFLNVLQILLRQQAIVGNVMWVK